MYNRETNFSSYNVYFSIRKARILARQLRHKGILGSAQFEGFSLRAFLDVMYSLLTFYILIRIHNTKMPTPLGSTSPQGGIAHGADRRQVGQVGPCLVPLLTTAQVRLRACVLSRRCAGNAKRSLQSHQSPNTPISPADAHVHTWVPSNAVHPGVCTVAGAPCCCTQQTNWALANPRLVRPPADDGTNRPQNDLADRM